MFPWQPHESSAPGDRFATFDIPEVGRLGLSICYDGSFPETCRRLAWMGAEVVLQVSLTTTSDRAQELLTDVLDIDAVTRVREHGTAGVSRLWEQAVRSAPALGFQPPPGEERSG